MQEGPLPFLELHTEPRNCRTAGKGKGWPPGITLGSHSSLAVSECAGLLAWPGPQRQRSLRTVISAPFTACRHDASFSQHSVHVPQISEERLGSYWWLLLLTSELGWCWRPGQAQLHLCPSPLLAIFSWQHRSTLLSPRCFT